MPQRILTGEHVVIHKRADRYTPFPSLDLLPDGRLAVGLWTAPHAEHYGFGEWLVRTSRDGGTPSALRTEPRSWTGDLGYPVSRELPDGTVFTAYYITTADGVTHTAGTRWRP